MQQSQDSRTTSDVYHATSYGSLYDLLLGYRQANALERQGLLCLAIKQLQDLQSDVQFNDDLALRQYETLVKIATLIRYAKNIHNLETHQDIDILFDFRNMSLLPDAQAGVTVDLRQWFEMNSDAPKMKFKKDIDAYSAPDSVEVWRSFEAARARHIALHGKEEFRQNHVQITDFSLHDDGLFPGVFTWMGRYHNETVDRVVYTKNGKILNIVTVEDEHFLSAGGMRNSHDDVLKRAIAETIEEHYGNIHLAMLPNDGSKSDFLYNLINLDKFKEVIQAIQTEYAGLFAGNNLQSLFEACTKIENGQNVLDKLCPLINEIDQLCKSQPKNKAIFLNMKANILSKLFAHSPLYQSVLQYLQTDMTIVRVPQLLDMRTGSGSQMTSLVLSRSLEGFIDSKVLNAKAIRCLADDVAHAHRTPMTLMEALSDCTKMKFSHILLMLEAYKYGAQKGDLHPGRCWKENHFHKARQAMINDIKQYLLKPQQLSAQGVTIIKKLLIKANVPTDLSTVINQRFHTLVTNINNGSDPNQEIIDFDQYVLQLIKSKKITDLITGILWVIFAGILITMGGFGVGLMAGAWTTPGAFFAILTSNPIVLTLSAAMLVSVMAITAYRQFGFFANNDKLYNNIKSVEQSLEQEIGNYFTYYK